MAFDMSKAAFGKASVVSNLDRIQMIDIYDIDTNDKNFYSIDGIEELAASIKMVGLLDPVRVVPLRVTEDQPYKYKLISGHRRHQAYQYLFDTEETGWDRIPSLVVSAMDDLTETFALITANSTARELSYAEKLKQEQLLRETLTAMKEAGKPVPKNLGQYIADQIGTSRNEVSRMHSINEHLIPEAREQVDKGEMTAQAAYELSRKPAEEQRETVSAGKRRSILDEANDESNVYPLAAVEALAMPMILELTARWGHIGSRAEGIAAMKSAFKWSSMPGRDGYHMTGSYDNGRPALTKSGEGYGYKPYYIQFSELWDLLGIAAMRRCVELSKLDTEEDKPSPAAELWHDGTPPDPGRYVTMYHVKDGSREARPTIMRWTGSEWQLHGCSVAGVYEVYKWTEVPEC